MRRASALLTVTFLLATVLAASPAALADGHEEASTCGGLLDVLFVFDTTGSMGGVLADATNGASQVMSAIVGQVPGAAFGVADYRDYPASYAYPGYASSYGGWGDYPWKLHQPISTATGDAAAAIGTLFASGGGDWPESMTRAMYETYSDGGVGWRAGSMRLVVLFTDAPAHDMDFAAMNFGSDPGRDGVAHTADDLDFETTVDGAAAAGVRMIGVGVGGNGGAPYLQHAARETDGAYAVLGSDFATQVTELILGLAGIRMHAHADAVLLDATTLVGEHLDVAHVEAGPHPDAHRETLNTILLPPSLNGWIRTADGRAATTETPQWQQAAARSTIESFSILGGLVEGTLLQADALVRADATGATPSTGATHVGEIRIAGTPITITPGVHVPLPNGLGYVVVDERIVTQTSWDTAEVEVNMVRVVLTAQGLDVDLKISHAFAAISCGTPHEDGPTPPRDPEVPPVPETPVTPGVPPLPVGPVCLDLGAVLSLCVAEVPCTERLPCPALPREGAGLGVLP